MPSVLVSEHYNLCQTVFSWNYKKISHFTNATCLYITVTIMTSKFMSLFTYAMLLQLVAVTTSCVVHPSHGHAIDPVSDQEADSTAIHVRALYGAEINPTRKTSRCLYVLFEGLCLAELLGVVCLCKIQILEHDYVKGKITRTRLLPRTFFFNRFARLGHFNFIAQK